jgi:hypothetical protein
MAHLYAVENFPFPVVEELRRLGHDVVTAQEAGKAEREIPDPEVLVFAIEQGRALLTLNRRHFIRLHLTQPRHVGIVACTFDPDFPNQAARIDTAIRPLTELRGRLIRVNRPSPLSGRSGRERSRRVLQLIERLNAILGRTVGTGAR